MIVFSLNQNGFVVGEERYTGRILTHNKLILEQFIRVKRLQGLSEETLRGYFSTVNNLSLGVGKRYEDMNTQDIRDYLADYQVIHKIKNQTLDDIRLTFSSFYNYLEEEDIIIKNPVRKIHKIKSETTIQHPFTDEEIIRIQDACCGIREIALVDFLNSSGVRVSELCKLDRTDINLKNREGIVFGKGSKERIIYFDARTKIHLEKYLDRRKDDNPSLFVTNIEPHNRLTKSGVEYIIARIGKRAGVNKCHPHRFRRTFATRLIDRGMPIEQVQKLLGHTKIETTLIYSQVKQENIKYSHSKFV
jgi:site-specific recombinase XerD